MKTVLGLNYKNKLIKMDNIITPEQIQRSVSAAFDSVNLINELNQKENLTEEETSTLVRNVEHLKIMIAKEWFKNALTQQQKSEINTILKIR